MNRDHSLIFETASKYCILDSFADYDGYSISSEGFLAAVVDIWSSELQLPILVHFSSLIPKMSMFTLAISCLTTSNLPWFTDLTLQVPMQCCTLQHQSLLPSQSHPHLGVFCLFVLFVCLFWLCLFILSGVISPLFSSSILGTYQPEEFIFQCHTLFDVSQC